MSLETATEKLSTLADAAKYDVACTSSGVSRGGQRGKIGAAASAGICHSFAGDGRCVSLLKLLMTNVCVYDCQYCVNRRSNDVPRATFTPSEIADLTINFYKRNYIEGLFLSSGVLRNPDYTMERMHKTLDILRNTHGFNGYIHAKVIPGASPGVIRAVGLLSDRVSVNIELPSENSLIALAPDKTRESILKPMKSLSTEIAISKNEMSAFGKSSPKFAPAGQSTQMIIGASPEKDGRIMRLAQGLYDKYALKRVFYSAYIPVVKTLAAPSAKPPTLREHRLYQADWLMRFYGFSAEELADKDADLDLNMDPKCLWALNNLDKFPIEINSADYFELLRVPGIGVVSAQKIVAARRFGSLTFDNIKKMGVALKRAMYFITCGGKAFLRVSARRESLYGKLSENKLNPWSQRVLEDITEDKPDWKKFSLSTAATTV
ncbi:MAG: putative DNA modification/repair radical SAM protein [Clostridiales bacterium]|jgi:putative DNA modification/repair radical SAM protein|nr:putative DNA modification/repair radical SAM protein [Clostridiales bacterium]